MVATMYFSWHKPWLLINIFILCSGVTYHGIISVIKPPLLIPVTLVFSFVYIMTLEINQLSDYFYQNI